MEGSEQLKSLKPVIQQKKHIPSSSAGDQAGFVSKLDELMMTFQRRRR